MAGRTDRAERVVRATPAAVWRALTEPELLVQWLPPAGMAGSFDRFDLRPGGGYRMILTYDDPVANAGKSGDGHDVVEGRFGGIEPGERLDQLIEFESDDPAFAGTMRMVWEIGPAETGTQVALRAENVPYGISAEDHQTGLASSLANLAALVEQTP
jgi:uncharacterized protein YndB with AHSA1/START domain